MSQKYNILPFAIFLGSLFSSLAAQATEVLVEKSKEYNFTLAAKDISLVSIDNQYGDVQVQIWNQNTIQVKVKVSANSSNERMISRYLDNIDIEKEVNKGTLSLKTIFKNDKIKPGEKGSSEYYKVKYEVSIPKNIKLKINNSFGNVDLPTFLAPLELNLSYGDLNSPEINNNLSLLKTRFSNVRVLNLTGANLNSAFSDLNLGKVNNVEITSTKDKILAGLLENIQGDLNYPKGLIKVLNEDINLKLNFSDNLTLEKLGNDLKTLEITSKYSDLLLPLQTGFNGILDVKTTNGNFFTTESLKVKITNQKKVENTKEVNAIIGSETKPSRRIIIHSINGDVKIKK